MSGTTSENILETLEEHEFEQRFQPVATPGGSAAWQADQLIDMASDRIWTCTTPPGAECCSPPGRHLGNVADFCVTGISHADDESEDGER